MISLTDKEFEDIYRYIRDNYGVNLEQKRPLIEGRLSHYISSLGFASFSDYFNYVKTDSSERELDSMLSRLTTNHTFFMRENEHFEFFNDKILPWVENTLNERDLRVWSAGCSSGEEAYTISMIIFEYIKNNPSGWDTTVLATDISSKTLLMGQNGEYPEDSITAINKDWLSKYFVKTNNSTYKVTDKMRKNVVFQKFNLLNEFKIKKPFHTIFCRNVMIYFDNETKNELVNKFYDSICDGGYLLIGHSESLSALDSKFKYISPSIYRKVKK